MANESEHEQVFSRLRAYISAHKERVIFGSTASIIIFCFICDLLSQNANISTVQKATSNTQIDRVVQTLKADVGRDNIRIADNVRKMEAEAKTEIVRGTRVAVSETKAAKNFSPTPKPSTTLRPTQTETLPPPPTPNRTPMLGTVDLTQSISVNGLEIPNWIPAGGTVAVLAFALLRTIKGIFRS